MYERLEKECDNLSQWNSKRKSNVYKRAHL